MNLSIKIQFAQFGQSPCIFDSLLTLHECSPSLDSLNNSKENAFYFWLLTTFMPLVGRGASYLSWFFTRSSSWKCDQKYVWKIPSAYEMKDFWDWKKAHFIFFIEMTHNKFYINCVDFFPNPKKRGYTFSFEWVLCI